MSTQPDNLDLALEGARTFLASGEGYLAAGQIGLAVEALVQVHAHLDWAREIIATRAKRAGRKAK